MVDLTNIFNEFIDEGDNFQSTAIVEPAVSIYPCVNPGDHEPVSVIEPDLKRGPWIAGGAALRWYQDRSVGENDIDVFCRDHGQAQSVIERIKSYNRFCVKHESDNAFTIDYHRKDSWEKRWCIQMITRRYFPDIESVIESFDLSVCQIATTGNEWVLGDQTARDIREHRLRFVGDLQPDALKRLVKYWCYGYRPVEGTIEAIQNNEQANWRFSEDGEYENVW